MTSTSPSRRRLLVAALALAAAAAGLGAWLKLRVADLPEVVVYDGYGKGDGFLVRGRVIEREQEARAADPARSKWGNLRDQRRAFTADEVSGATVRVAALGTQVDVRADEEGYFEASGACTAGCPGMGMTSVHAQVIAPLRWAGARGEGVVHRVADEAGVGIISDIDDTVVQSYVTEPGKMIGEAAFKNAAQLTPVAGAGAAFRGAVAAGASIVVYVSGSPMGFYPRIREFMDRTGLPRGPLLLKDFSRDPIFAQDQYKPARIQTVLDAFPKLQFVLVGDSGEKDPEIYRAVAAAHPGRVAGIVIRTAPGGADNPERFAGTKVISDYASDPNVLKDLVARAAAR